MGREVIATWQGPYRTDVRVGPHAVVFDAPKEIGGGDEGPSPGEMLLGAIGS